MPTPSGSAPDADLELGELRERILSCCTNVRDREVAAALIQGAKPREIAADFKLSPRETYNTIRRIRRAMLRHEDG